MKIKKEAVWKQKSKSKETKTTKNCARNKTINLGWPSYIEISQISLCWNLKCVAIVWVFCFVFVFPVFMPSSKRKVKRINCILKPQVNVF